MKVAKSKDLTNDAASYSGHTYTTIRSGKHSGSTASHHLRDMNNKRLLPEFTDSFRDKSSKEKVMIVTVDGGHGENLRYANTINYATECFNEHNLDAYFVATYAPGPSAFNQVKMSMSNLSKELSGVILPHDHFRNHLYNNNNNVDEELELKNFEYAGEILANFSLQLLNLSGKTHRASLSQSRKNGKPIMSVSCNTS